MSDYDYEEDLRLIAGRSEREKEAARILGEWKVDGIAIQAICGLIRESILAEREACARIADAQSLTIYKYDETNEYHDGYVFACEQIARCIRDRGEKGQSS